MWGMGVGVSVYVGVHCVGVGVLDVGCFCEGGCVVCMYICGCPCVYAHNNPTIHVVYTYSTYVDSKVKSLSVGTIKK